ncbi:MAG: hypothetical protein WA869_10760 [Alloacidobacterium sp.]|jgi:hypothetical protein
MDNCQVRFQIFSKPGGITIAYARVENLSQHGFVARGHLATDFESVDQLKGKLREVGLPQEIAVPTHESYSVTEEQLARLGFTGEPY